MLPISLLLLVSALSGVGRASPLQVPLALPHDGTEESSLRKDTGLKGRFLHLTDMHPDMHYRPDTAESTACHRRKPKKEKERGGYYGLPYGDCDSPFTLTNFTLDFLEKHWAKEIDFVIWTGDSVRHDNDREVPRTPDEIYELNRAMTRRMSEIFTSRGIPVVPTLGNNDVWPHNIMAAGPNSITNEFASIWRAFVPFESFQVFQRGGYYAVEVIPNEVAVISMNTMYFYDSNKAVGGCEYGEDDDPGNLQFDWLEVQLDRYRERGMQVWLSGHVPPSPGNYFPGCFVQYADLALRYQDTILGHLFGHMNMDHFFFLEVEDTVLPEEGSGAQRHASLAETLLEDFSALPKKGKTDLDEYAVINVGPSVVPNPYVPTFRVFAYNETGEASTTTSATATATATASDETVGARAEPDSELQKKKKKDKKGKKRKHGHRHPGKEAEVDCKKKANRGVWACRPRKPHYASGDSPSRRNTQWTPLGYAQYWLPRLEKANRDTKPQFKLEYTTMSASDARRAFPLQELPPSLRGTSGEAGDGSQGGKYTPYLLEDLTIRSYMGLGRRLGDEKEDGLREVFRRQMYQSVE